MMEMVERLDVPRWSGPNCVAGSELPLPLPWKQQGLSLPSPPSLLSDFETQLGPLYLWTTKRSTLIYFKDLHFCENADLLIFFSSNFLLVNHHWLFLRFVIFLLLLLEFCDSYTIYSSTAPHLYLPWYRTVLVDNFYKNLVLFWKAPGRLHYLVWNALYLHENSWSYDPTTFSPHSPSQPASQS